MPEPKLAIDSEEYFESIYQHYKKKALNTSLNIVQNLSDAEEIMQDVFVEFYFKRVEFRGEASIGTWIYRITVNKSLDLLKKKKRQKHFAWFTSLFDPSSGKELHVSPDFQHPGVIMENEESTMLLFKNIEKLPEKQKTALILSVMEQLSYDEISLIMETTVSSVESLLFRARQNLRKWLEPQLNKK